MNITQIQNTAVVSGPTDQELFAICRRAMSQSTDENEDLIDQIDDALTLAGIRTNKNITDDIRSDGKKEILAVLRDGRVINHWDDDDTFSISDIKDEGWIIHINPDVEWCHPDVLDETFDSFEEAALAILREDGLSDDCYGNKSGAAPMQKYMPDCCYGSSMYCCDCEILHAQALRVMESLKKARGRHSALEQAIFSYLMGWISLGRAAELSGLCRGEFEAELAKQGIDRNYYLY